MGMEQTHDYIGRKEHEEFAKRMEDEHHRLSKRITEAVNEIKEIGKIANAVDKLANNMELMLKEQQEQGERLEKLEARDGEMWRKAVGYVITAIISAVIGYVTKTLGM
jgi:hypothetical protein